MPFLWAIRPCILRLNERNEEDQVYYVQEGDLHASSISKQPDHSGRRAVGGDGGNLDRGSDRTIVNSSQSTPNLTPKKQLSNAEAAALVTDKALALLAETEERLHQEITELEQDLAEAKERLKEYQTTVKELEAQLKDCGNALWLAKQQAVRLQRLVNKLARQLKEAGITPKPLDF